MTGREGDGLVCSARSDSDVEVSVVVPAYNAERYIRDTLDSVLRQTFTRFECLVVDDGSTDGTAEIIRSVGDARVHHVPVPHGGVARARNHGIARAKGDWVALLDSDDVWLPDKLQEQLCAARRVSGAGLVLCGYYVSTRSLAPVYRVVPRRGRWAIDDWMLLQGNGPAMGSTALLRRDLVGAVGGFAEVLTTSADLDFAYRLAEAAPVVTVRRPLVHYRSHGEQMHLDVDAFEVDMGHVFQMTLHADPQRRRRGEANLHTRLFLTAVRRRETGRARRHLRRALELQPSRLLLLPASAAARKTRQRLGAAMDRHLGNSRAR